VVPFFHDPEVGLSRVLTDRGIAQIISNMRDMPELAIRMLY
jgi:hypothetical protein